MNNNTTPFTPLQGLRFLCTLSNYSQAHCSVENSLWTNLKILQRTTVIRTRIATEQVSGRRRFYNISMLYTLQLEIHIIIIISLCDQ